jgi:3-oxoadipate enol-lactonase
LISGRGPETIVLLHEMGMCLESWDEAAQLLEQRFSVLRYDLRGFGLSEKVRGDISMQDEVNDLRCLMQELKFPSPTILVGSAVGGAIALAMAASHPSKVKAVIAISPAAYLSAQVDRQSDADARSNQSPRELLERSFDVSYPAALRRSDRVARFRAIRLSTDPISHAATMRMAFAESFHQRLRTVRCPTLIIAGALQRRAAEDYRLLAQEIPGAEFLVIESGHFAALQSPELLVTELYRFLIPTVLAE